MDGVKTFLRGRIVSPEGITAGQGLLEVTGRSITFSRERGMLAPGPEHRVYDFGSNYICPGFIDLHVHGAGGTDVLDGTCEALDRMAKALAEGGTTSFLASTISASRRELEGAVKNVALAKQKGTGGAEIIGVHLEGPFLNPRKKGAHARKNLRAPDVHELTGYLAAGAGAGTGAGVEADTMAGAGADIVRMITLAPELPGAPEVIAFARSRGLVVALGHSVATRDQVEEACRAGLSHATHVFNAMGGLDHRELGTAGAVISLEQVTADVIPDGLHVHPEVIKILVRAKGLDRVCAVTDGIRAGGLGDGTFAWRGRRVMVRDGIARLADGTIAGSVIRMAQAVKTLVEKVGLPLEQAVRLASTNPARVLSLNSKGVLAPGKDADITVLDAGFKVLMTIVAGKIVYQGSNE